MTKAELDRLKYETISFKDIITGGWTLKYQACTVNNYNSYLFFWWTARAEGERDMFRLPRSTGLFLCRKNCTFFSRETVTKRCRLQRGFLYVKL